MLRTISVILSVFILSLTSGIAFVQAGSADYPGRALYPDVHYLTTDEFHQAYEQAIIVDARSNLEYQTIRIPKAIRHGVYDADFAKQIKKLRSDHSDKKIIFYCNGHTCMKSYKAAKKAMQAGVDNVYAYDSGIFEWSEAYPDLSVLVGNTPVDVKQLREHKKRLKQHELSVQEFVSRVNEDDNIVLDVRSNKERFLSSPLFLLKDKSLSLKDPEKMKQKLRRLMAKDKPFLFYDNAGRTIVWLAYYLDDLGIENYSFMKGGAYEYARYELKESFFKDQPEKSKSIDAIFDTKKK